MILREIVHLSSVNENKVPPESQFLLEIDFGSLLNSPVERQAYWVSAMKTAWKAGRRRGRLKARMGAGARRRALRKRKVRPLWQFEKLERQLREELGLRRPGRTRGVSAAGFETQNGSNKRLKRPS